MCNKKSIKIERFNSVKKCLRNVHRLVQSRSKLVLYFVASYRHSVYIIEYERSNTADYVTEDEIQMSLER